MNRGCLGYVRMCTFKMTFTLTYRVKVDRRGTGPPAISFDSAASSTHDVINTIISKQAIRADSDRRWKQGD